MIKNCSDLSRIKKTIEAMYKKPVEVTLNLGRNKYVVFNGTLVGVYPALFTVSPFDKSFTGKTSYSYSEYMCGKVSIKESAQ